jgi:predicted O-linked N-acetylglucosamine transferase (SPINDLY family)
MRSVEEAFTIALRQHQAGDCQRAAVAYEEILRHQPDHPGALHLLGVTYQQRGDFPRAVQCIAKAISLDDSKAVYHNNLGVALRGLGKLEEAADAYRRALAIRPQYADALSNLAVVLKDMGQEEESLRLLLDALRIEPQHADALYNLGNVYHELGQTAEAIACYRQSIAIRPGFAGAHNNLGNALLAAKQVGEAVAAYRQSIALAPREADAYRNLGTAYAEEQRLEEAVACFEQASRLRPEKTLWKWRSVGLCPAVMESTAQIDEYRADLERQLDAARQTAIQQRWEDLPRDGFCPSFNVKHFGGNPRPLREKFAAVFDRFFPQRRPRLGNGKPRIGFVVTRQHEGGMVRVMGGIIEGLDPGRFDVVILCSQAALAACQAGIRRENVQWVAFPDDFARAAERIGAAQCDVLYHRQIGTDPLNYFLPFARLAPIQCTSSGSHVTTGMPAVDYFLSSRLTEPDDGQSHYTERLHCFSILPEYHRRPSPPGPVSRSEFGLPEGRNLYLCPGHLAKFHPDHDRLLRGVLESDPAGLVVAVEDRQGTSAARLKARLARTLSGVFPRMVFVPPQSPEAFRRLMATSDVMLDTWHYAASLMAYDAMGVGLPIVTLPDEYNNGRVVLGVYRRMGLEKLAARSPEHYVSLAVRLGTNRDERESVRAEILQRGTVLFDDARLVREHEQFFEAALQDARRRAE